MTTRLRIAYAGTPEFAVPALQALYESAHRLVLVLTQPDRPAGRGLDLRQSAVKHCATGFGIPVFQPQTLRDPQAFEPLREVQPDLLVVAAYGLILPQAVLDLPRFGCVNIHASLLPRWRGAAPIQRAIAAGDPVTGVSIMQMEAGLDTGPVFLRRETPITEADTGGSLHDRLAALGAQALTDALPGIADGTLEAEPQDAARATLAPKIQKREACIDWTRPAEEIARLVRAFNPWPVCETLLDGKQLRIWSAEVAQHAAPAGQSPDPPGTVIDAREHLLVATGAGLLRLNQVQPAGKRAMPARDFLHARRDLQGRRLG